MRTKLLLAAISATALSACSDPDGARRVLQEQGYTNIVMIGSPWFGGCSKDDQVVDEFRATNLAGKPTHGVVCSGLGWGKASTIRLYGDR